jgi:hypothetical protein
LAGEGEFGGEADGGFHAVRAGDALTSDLEGRAVVGASANEWKAEGDIHPSVKGMELERDQALVVIHAKDAIEFPLHRTVENRVRRERALEVAVAFQFLNGGGDDVDFIAAEVAIFTGVGI